MASESADSPSWCNHLASLRARPRRSATTLILLGAAEVDQTGPMPVSLASAFRNRLPVGNALPSSALRGPYARSPAKASPAAASSNQLVPCRPASNPLRKAASIKHTVRGAFPTSDLTMQDKAACEAELLEDVLAKTTAESKQSHINTWARFHIRWFGLQVPVFPLTVVKVRAVASQFKSCGYRSYPNYVSTVKDLFLEQEDTRPAKLLRYSAGPYQR